tara:strand:- start:565 stop:2193 length:1629 start_codon:yes stop_codon:yes gene_type:complete
MGGSSGGGTSRSTQNVTSTVTQSDLPKEFYPYLQKQMQMADALLQQDYIPYQGQRTAAYTPEQQMAFQGLTGVGTRNLAGIESGRNYFQGITDSTDGPDYLKATSGYTGDGTFGSGYTGSGTFGSGYTGEGDFGSGYTAGTIRNVYDPTATRFGSGYTGSDIQPTFQGADIRSDYRPGQFDAGDLASDIERFQNPYTEQVLNTARDRATKQFQEQQAQRQAKLSQAGGASAFGSRGTLANLTAEDDFLTRQAAQEAQLLSQGFDKASALAGSNLDRILRTQQLSDTAERARAKMLTDAQIATGQFGQAAGAQSLQAQIAADASRRAAGSQELQAQQAADRARQVYGSQSLQAQQAQERLRQIQGEQTIRSAIARDAALRAGGAQTLQAQQLRDQAKRAGGAQTLQAQIARDAALGRAGAQDLQADIANQRAYAAAVARGDQAAVRAMEADRLEQQLDLQRLGALNALGADLRAQDQSILDQRFADFQRQRDYPYEQLQFYSNLLRGNVAPLRGPEQVTTSAPGPNQLGQLANFLLGARALGT